MGQKERSIQSAEVLTKHGLLIIYLSQAVCLLCREQIAVLKDYDLNHHYNTKHIEN